MKSFFYQDYFSNYFFKKFNYKGLAMRIRRKRYALFT